MTGATPPPPRPPASFLSLPAGSESQPALVGDGAFFPFVNDYMDIFGAERRELDRIVVRCCHEYLAQARGADLLWASSSAVGGPLRTAQVALSTGGRGFEVFRTGVTVSTMARALVELRGVVAAGLPSTIFNSTAVSTIVRFGRKGDYGRAMLSLSMEALSSIGGASALAEVLEAFASLCRLLSSAFGLNYAPFKPIALISSPGAAEQRPHTDGCPPSLVMDPPRMLGAFLAIEPSIHLPAWPRSHVAVQGEAKTGGGIGAVVHLSVCELLVFRGDTAHCGTSNPSASAHHQLHSYIISNAHRSTFDVELTYPLPKWSLPLPKPRRRRSSPWAA